MVESTDSLHSRVERPKADVLLVTVTEVEAQAVLNLARELFSREPRPEHIGLNTYFDLGEIGEYRAFMVCSEMGSGGSGGSTLTSYDGIMDITPSAVIMVGIAFGVNPKKQTLGDILVSKWVRAYELQRYGTTEEGKPTIILRGDRVSAPARMQQRFKAAALTWKGPRIIPGLILSGEKLIDNAGLRDQLLSLEPEAIGGEMEGAGLCAAANRRKADWIVVKAICDWADGKKHRNKRRRQLLAAENAARFVLHVIEQGGFGEGIKGSSQGLKVVEPAPMQDQDQPHPMVSRNAVTPMAIPPQPSDRDSPTCSERDVISVSNVSCITLLEAIGGHEGQILGIAFAPVERVLASASEDHKVRLWSLAEGRITQSLDHPARVNSISYSRSGKLLASGSLHKIRVWRVASAKLVRSFNHRDVQTVAFSPNGRMLASGGGSLEGTVRLWQVAGGASVRTMYHQRAVHSVAFSPDGKILASSGADKTVRLWRVQDGKLLRTLDHNDIVYSVAVSPDGETLVSGSRDCRIRLWRVTNGSLLRTLEGHTGSVRYVTVAPDGEMIASASEDRTVRLWHLPGCSLVNDLEHDSGVCTVTFSQDERLLASGTSDGTVCLWGIP